MNFPYEVHSVAAQAVMEHPWQGVGWEHVAGAPEYVFNEYLQVAMAWGVPALCGILLVVTTCFCLGHREGQIGICGSLLSLGVFAFSSYPFQFMEFVLAFLALLVACAMGYRRAWLQVLAVVLGIGIGLCAYGYRKKHPGQRVHAMFNRAHSLHKAGDWEASTELLKETMRISSDAMVLNIIGKNCQALGEYKEAEAWFVRSTLRLPNRIYPYYLFNSFLSSLSFFWVVSNGYAAIPKLNDGAPTHIAIMPAAY
jgi:hypothetical protein